MENSLMRKCLSSSSIITRGDRFSLYVGSMEYTPGGIQERNGLKSDQKNDLRWECP